MSEHGTDASAVGRFAGWLASKPTNAVLAMVVALPIAPPLAGAVLIQQWLVHGVRGALLRAGLTLTAVVLAVALVSPAYASALALLSGAVLGVSGLVALVLERTGSTTLTAQLTLLLAIIAIVWLHAGDIDPGEVWKIYADYFRSSVADDAPPEVVESVETLVSTLHEIAVASTWMAVMIALFLGYSLYALMPEHAFSKGRFSDLNLGRIMAAVMITACVALAFTASHVARGVALCLLVAFFLQGLALLHWFVRRRRAGYGLLVATYIALLSPFFGAQALLIFFAMALLVLSVVGYIDAWFGIRTALPAAP